MKILFIAPIFFFISFHIYPQNKNTSSALTLLDSVKTFYGDTCEIGVNSSLMNRLYQYKDTNVVNNYLRQYQEIRNTITKFRKEYLKAINENPAMLLDISRVFNNSKQDNIINACGIYFGPDSVTNLVVSYTIVRSTVSNFYFNVIQLLNFDKTFKKELSENGKDWYYSLKLENLDHTPFKITANEK